MTDEKAPTPAALRNVAFVGPSGSGTSSVFDQLAKAGRATRAETWGQLRAITVQRDGVVLTALDTPGEQEFEADVRAALRAVDNVVFVLAATAGVDAATIALWEECARLHIARFIVITHLDQPHADYDEMVAICQRVFGPEIVAVHYPVLADDGSLGGLIDIVSMQVKDHTASLPISRAADPEHVTLLAPARLRIGEALLSSSASSAVIEAVMDERDLESEVLKVELHRAVASGDVAPVLVASTSPIGLGADELLDLLVTSACAPAEFAGLLVTDLDGDPIAPLNNDPDGFLAAQVIAAPSNRDGGALVRVFGGTLHAGNVGLVHDTHVLPVTIGQLSYPGSTGQRDPAVAGSLVAVHGVAGLRPSDTLTDAKTPLRIAAWSVPRPQHPLHVQGASTEAVRASLAVDRAVRVADDVVWCMGEKHAQVLQAQLRADLGPDIHITAAAPRLRETITDSASASSTDPDIRLSISVAPLLPGTALEINGLRALSEGSARLDAALRDRLAKGPRAGLPLLDVAISIDTPPESDINDHFIAIAQATLIQAIEHAHPVLVEPQVRIVVRISQEDLDVVIQDLNNRRAHGIQTTNEPGGTALLTAQVPDSEMSRYAIKITNVFEGGVLCEISNDGFTPLPNYLAERYLSTQLDSSNSRV